MDRLSSPDTNARPGQQMSLSALLTAKAPQTNIETATCIAYWWETCHPEPITTGDLGRLNVESGLPVWSDPGSTAQGAMTTRRWLERAVEKGTWRVSAEGRRMVEALPDRSLITGTRAYA